MSANRLGRSQPQRLRIEQQTAFQHRVNVQPRQTASTMTRKCPANRTTTKMGTTNQQQEAATTVAASDDLPDFMIADGEAGADSIEAVENDGAAPASAQADDAAAHEAAQPGNFDKGLANHTKKTAERFDKIEASIGQLTTQLQQTLTTLQAKADAGGKGAGAAAEAAKEVQSTIDELESLDDDTIVYGETLKAIAKKLKGGADEGKIAEIVAQQVEKALSSRANSQATEQQLASAFDQQFDSEFPALAGKSDEYLQGAIDAVTDADPDLASDSPEWRTAVKTQLRISAKRANGSAASNPAARQQGAQVGLKRTSPESTAGTGNTNAGAGAAGPLAADEIGRDTDGLPDFFSGSGTD